MRKFLLSVAISLVSFAALSAQTQEQPTWWGYYTPGMSVNAVGTGWSVVYDVAAFIPGGTYFAKGATISGVRFSLPNTQNVKDVCVWMAKRLPTNVAQADIAVKSLANSSLKRGQTNEVLFDEPYTVTDGGVYVGYTLNISTVNNDNDIRPIAYTADVHAPHSLYLRTSDGLTEWADYSEDFGALAMQLLFTNGLTHNAVGAQGSEAVSASVNGTSVVPVTLVNYSPDGVTSIDYTVTSDGVKGDVQHYTLEEPFTAYGPFLAKLPVSVGDKMGEVKKTVTVTHVNGTENTVAAKDASTDITLNVLGESLPKKVVIEEFSGTWCLWCPMGTKGVELSEEKFGDKVIAIEVHDQDILWDESLGYDPLIGTLIGLPACFINRGPELDPYYGSAGGKYYGLDADIQDELGRTAEATIDLTASWDGAMNKIEAVAGVQFQIDAKQSDYALGYVVTAGTLTGTGKDWAQSNGLSGDTSLDYDDNLLEFINGPKTIANATFHNVAVAAAGVESGVKGSVKAPIVAGERQEHTQTFDLSENKTVQDKYDLSVVAFLLNTKTGRIVNAEKVKVDNPEGVGTAELPQATEAIFNIQGQRLVQMQRGVNILRGADGSARKILVK
ncbi:MAG: hypothetical protein IJ659_08615 [Alloprevotella sp.]|nr:hypothetical protein [Alloprevotella sp.]